MMARSRIPGGFVASAVAAGLILAAANSHDHAGNAAAAGTAVAAAAPAGSNEALANSMAASGCGWTGSQATCLDDLWNHESGFDACAANPSSDARGIPQNINGWSGTYQPGNASQQITWGLAYIAGRYGTPRAAWAFEMSHTPNWY